MKNKKIIKECLLLVICAGMLWYVVNQRQIISQEFSNEAITLYFKGKTLEAEGKYDEALKAFKRSIEIEPNRGKAHLMLGAVYEKHNLNTPPLGGDEKLSFS